MYLNWFEQEGEFSPYVSSSTSIIKAPSPGPTQGFRSELPADIIADIMSRLPEKDLFLLKLVSKYWNFVISRICIPRLCPPYPCAPVWGLICFEDPLPSPPPGDKYKLLQLIFSSMGRYMRFVHRPSLFQGKPTIEDHILSLLPSKERDPADIRDCCNGLILTASDSQYYVGNPVTRQRLSIPLNPHHHLTTKTIHSSLVFDPSLFLSFSKDPFFKIVTFIRPAQHASLNHPMEVDIFCSEKGEWSSHVLLLDQQIYGFEWLQRSVYFNGVLYSLSKAMYLVCIDNIIPIPGSNNSDLRAWAIELPDKNDGQTPTSTPTPTDFGCIGHSSGRFYYSNRNMEGSSISVWMLENSEWFLMHNINIEENDFGKGTIVMGKKLERCKRLDCFRPRAFLPNDEDLIFIATPELIVSYHVKTEKTKYVHVPWPCSPHQRRRTIKVNGNWIFPFSPCLLPLNTSTPFE